MTETNPIAAAIEGAPVWEAPPGWVPPADAPPPDEAQTEKDPCPVVALGHHDGVYVFLSPSGELRKLTVRDMSANGLLSLFSGEPGWMVRNYRRLDKEGNPTEDFVIRGVVGHLIRASEAVGLYDPTVQLRGLGVWASAPGRDGRRAPVLHCGDAIYTAAVAPRDSDLPLVAAAKGAAPPGVQGKWHSAGFRDGNSVYPAKPKMRRPAFDKVAGIEDGTILSAHLDLWNWANRRDRLLYLGLIGMALLGGFPGWRVHGLIIAAHGSGKSRLLELTAAILGPMGSLFNDFTEAGVRNVLGGEARVALLDEAEGDGGSEGPVAKAIGLIRRMSGGEGASIVRGSPGQIANASTVTGCAILAGINPPALTPQDRSRIHAFEIVKRVGDPTGEAKVIAAIAWAHANSARLRARAITRWDIFAKAVALYRPALIMAGCDGRQADLLAGLLAGRDLLLHDYPPDSDTLEQAVADLAEHIAFTQEEDVEDSDAQQCLSHLMTYETADWRQGERTTIGNMISEAFSETDPEDKNRAALARHGLRLEVDVEGRLGKSNRFYLVVAPRHSGLERIFSGRVGQKWQGRGWVRSLSRLLPDISRWPSPLWFAGTRGRGVAIPEGFLPPPSVAPVAPPETDLAGGAIRE
ncbi:hypothetical protein [Nitrospirillum sp. BR 11163]|uniref:hypothetical protein n=1 Tax=Nitrospirillum sp. BR 11163 TaxID=3104323 RepID=UPI002AFDD739|nr:hypothetical protein [Nitrospirillum sp. BR 11163]MEA1674085.1 hypothetical protein [Nitrospirillum sp. BR 11163]